MTEQNTATAATDEGSFDLSPTSLYRLEADAVSAATLPTPMGDALAFRASSKRHPWTWTGSCSTRARQPSPQPRGGTYGRGDAQGPHPGRPGEHCRGSWSGCGCSRSTSSARGWRRTGATPT